MVLLEIKKQHVSAYHWPSSDFLKIYAVRVLYNIANLQNTLTA